MKKSEFIEHHMKHGTPDHRKEAEMAADLAERAGAKWDPEEPEMPERVWAIDGMIFPEGKCSIETSCVEDEANSREAAARHNAVSRFLVEHPAAPTLQRILAQEREKLRRSYG